MRREDYIKQHGRKSLNAEIKRLKDRREDLIRKASDIHENLTYQQDPISDYYNRRELRDLTEKIEDVEEILSSLQKKPITVDTVDEEHK